jgi:hypothetical protein
MLFSLLYFLVRRLLGAGGRLGAGLDWAVSHLPAPMRPRDPLARALPLLAPPARQASGRRIDG